MSKVMMINVANPEEHRIAIVSDGLLEEISIETSGRERIEGNIYKARVDKVIPSLDAAFVDYGTERNGFLPIQDVHPRYLADGKRTIQGLKRGQDLMVQVRKGELGQKGAALTTYISLPGRYFVLMPFVNKRGVSRKVQDDATRKQLRKVLDATGIPEEMGYIARTAAEGRTKQELSRDAGYLLRLWRRIQKDYDAAKGPAPLYQESGIVIRTIRDYFTPSIREVWVDDTEVYEQVRSFFQAVMPWYTSRVRRFQKKAPLFSKYNLEAQIASIYERSVKLPSGGSIVIEQTEALVSVDVNSGGGFKGRDIEETALTANKEAALETARQLRLRDLGGLVVIDFIDMRSSAGRSEVRKVLQKALKEDKARTDVGTISKFGLLELSRQRLKPAATVAVTDECPLCGGSGKVRSAESFALSVLRMIQSELARGRLTEVRVGVPPETATLLLNRKRDKLAAFEATFGVRIVVFPEPALLPSQYYIEYLDGDGKRVDTNLPPETPRDGLRTPEGLPDLPEAPTRLTAYLPAEGDDDEPTPEIEVPPEPADERGGAAEDDGETDEDGAPKKKRRRRRRRKKKSGEDAESGDAEALEDAGEDAGGEEPDPEEANGETDEDGAPKKKRRRRRRRRKKKTEAEDAEDGTGEDEPADRGDAEPTASEEEEAGEPEDGAPRKKRRRRRRKKKTDTEAGAEDAPDADTGPDRAEADGDAGTGELDQPMNRAEEEPPGPAAEGRSEADKPKPKRAPRRRKKPTAEQPTEAPLPAGEPEAGPAPVDPDTPEKAAGAGDGEPEKPKRKRAPRRKKAAAEPAGPDQPASQQESLAPEGDDPAAPQTSKRRPARKKKAGEADPAGGEDAQTKPKPKRRTRKPAAVTATTGTPAAGDTAGPETQTKPARRTRKKAAEPDPEPS